MNLKKCKGIYE